jgi:hypothetical protein
MHEQRRSLVGLENQLSHETRLNVSSRNYGRTQLYRQNRNKFCHDYHVELLSTYVEKELVHTTQSNLSGSNKNIYFFYLEKIKLKGDATG